MQFLRILLLAIALMGLAGTGYFYFQYQNFQKELQSVKANAGDVKNQAQEETKKLAEELKKCSTSSAQLHQPRIVIKNGTTKVGLTDKVETKLRKTVLQLNVLAKENAQSKTYEKTTVVVLDSSGKDMGERIAKALDTTVGTLPAGEVAPKDADVMVIIGKDQI